MHKISKIELMKGNNTWFFVSMHKISKTELMKPNDATWIHVKVCIKPQVELGNMRHVFME